MNAQQYVRTSAAMRDVTALTLPQPSNVAQAARPAGAAAHATPIATATPAAPSPTPVTAPPPDPAADVSAALVRSKFNPTFAAQYLSSSKRTGTPWQILAAVHYVESTQSGDTARASYAGAIGPMQFLPSTFRAYAVDGDGDGKALITDVDDAIASAARYLAANGAGSGRVPAALYRYNHSDAYVNHVLSIAAKLGY